MAKGKKVVIAPEEEEVLLSPEEKIEKAELLAEMAKGLGSYQHQSNFCKQAMRILKPMLEEDPELIRKYRPIRKQMYIARCMGRIQLYERACHDRDTAKTASDFEFAAKQFERIAEYDRKYVIREKFTSPDLYSKATACDDYRQQADYCFKRMKKIDQGSSVRRIGILVLLVALAAGGFFFYKSDSSLVIKGKAESALGIHDKAWQAYREAYNNTGDDRYLQASYKEQYAAADKYLAQNQLTYAGDNFRALAAAGYSDAGDRLAEIDRTLMESAAAGEKIHMAGSDWLVLDKDGSRLLLLRSSAMKEVKEEVLGGGSAWSDSGIRKYLGSTYIDEKFTPDEQKLIETTHLAAEKNPVTGETVGEDTDDKIFLLSSAEFEKYKSFLKKSENGWFLRTPGREMGSLAWVNVDTTLMDYGYDMANQQIRLRPALWIDTAKQ